MNEHVRGVTMELEQQQIDNTQALALEHSSLLTQLKAISKIKDADQYNQVVAWRAVFDTGIKYFGKLYDERIAEAYRHWKALIKDRDGLQKPAEEGWKIGGDLLVNYDNEQIRIAKERQREEEAAKMAERRRLADLALEMQQPELADEIESRPLEPTVIVRDTPITKETGVYFKEDWKNWEFEDIEQVPREYLYGDPPLDPDQYPRITKVVRALKSETRIAGVRVLPPTKTPIQRRG